MHDGGAYEPRRVLVEPTDPERTWPPVAAPGPPTRWDRLADRLDTLPPVLTWVGRVLTYLPRAVLAALTS